MSTPINLNRARKARAKQDKLARAEQNVAKFGRTKSQKQREQDVSDKAARQLDGHRQDP